MGRQMRYPDFYPTVQGSSDRWSAWAFLLGNQVKAPEACALWLENEFERVSKTAMVRKLKEKGIKGSFQRADWKGFANIDLTEKDKDAVRGGILDGETVLGIFADILGTGHKVTISYDPDRDTTSLAITGAYTHCPNAGLTFTSFARDISSVMTVAAYKHEVIAKGDWSKFVSKIRQEDDLG